MVLKDRFVLTIPKMKKAKPKTPKYPFRKVMFVVPQKSDLLNVEIGNKNDTYSAKSNDPL